VLKIAIRQTKLFLGFGRTSIISESVPEASALNQSIPLLQKSVVAISTAERARQYQTRI
jgi:hypothetical protein